MSNVQDLPKWVELDDGVNLATVTFYEALGYSQGYEKIGGNVLHRTLDGTGVKQHNWAKLKTAVSGKGGLPLGFSGLDYTGLLTLKCGAARSITSSANAIVVPASRRVDPPYLPTGKKLVDGFYLDAPVNIAGNTVTVTLDAQATAYMVLYFPQLQVYMNDPSESTDIISASASWSFVAEEF